jgi:hypothetical protein
MYGGHTHWMRNRTAIGGTTFAQLGTFYAHVPGLIVLSAGTQRCCDMPCRSTDPVILFEYTFIEYGKEI